MCLHCVLKLRIRGQRGRKTRLLAHALNSDWRCKSLPKARTTERMRFSTFCYTNLGTYLPMGTTCIRCLTSRRELSDLPHNTLTFSFHGQSTKKRTDMYLCS